MVGPVAWGGDMTEVVQDGIPVGSDLLRMSLFTAPGTKTPLMMEFKVNPATGPFLVTSTRGVMWVSPREPKVRAAFRDIQQDTFFREVVQAVADTGVEASWGNVQPLTAAGLLAAIAHVRSYDLSALEVLMHPKTVINDLPVRETTEAEEVVRTICGFPVEFADWLDVGVVVVLPQDRDYVGFIVARGGRGVAVIHNASRGMAVCRNPA